MSNKYDEVVKETYIETLENLAFVFSDPLEKEEALELLGDNEFYLSSMEFSGGMEGSLKLATETEVGDIIAENMLGMTDEEDDMCSLCIDSIKEITNVICGKLMTDIAGTEPIINLSIPEVSKIEKEDFKELLEDEASLIFNSEEYLVVLIFKLNQ